MDNFTFTLNLGVHFMKLLIMHFSPASCYFPTVRWLDESSHCIINSDKMD